MHEGEAFGRAQLPFPETWNSLRKARWANGTEDTLQNKAHKDNATNANPIMSYIEQDADTGFTA